MTTVAAAASCGCAGRINDTIWQPFTDWSYATRVGTIIHESNWLFAVIESCHLIGLALMGGAVLVVDFRLLGLGLSDESPAKLSRAAHPWLIAGLVMMLITGVLLYLSEATKFYSSAFWDGPEFPFIYKMLFLILAVAFTFSVRRQILASDEMRRGIWQRLVGLISILLWLGVAIGGRGIGFY